MRRGWSRWSPHRRRQLREQVGDESGQAQSLVNLARLARQRGDDSAAVPLLERALPLLDTGQDTRVLANALASLGDALRESEPGRATDLLTRSLDVNQRLDIPDGVAVATNGLARLALAEGDVPRALSLAQQVLDLSNDSGNREGSTVAYQLLGAIHIANNEPEKAVSALDRAIQQAVEQEDHSREARSRLIMAEAYVALGDLEQAATQRDAGLAAATAGRDHRTQAQLEQLRLQID